MKKQIIITCITAAMLTLMGCAETPKDVQERIDILDNAIATETSQVTSSSDGSSSLPQQEAVLKGSLKQITECLSADLQNNNSRIVVKDARIGAEAMPLCDVSIGNSGFDSFKSICKYVYNGIADADNDSLYSFFAHDDPLDPSRPATDRFTLGENGEVWNVNSYVFDLKQFVIDKSAPTIGAYSHSTGFFKASVSGYNDYFWWQNFTPVVGCVATEGVTDEKCAEAICYRDDALKNTTPYKMRDGQTWTLAEAAKYTEDFFNNELSKLDCQDIIKLEYRVKTAFVIDFGDESFGFYFWMEMLDENGAFFDTAKKYRTPDEVEKQLPFPVENELKAYFYEKEKFAYVEKGVCFDEYKVTDENPELLSLAGAIKVLDETLASKKSLYFPRAELNYVLTCKQYPFHKLWGLGDLREYHRSVCLVNCEFELRPTWCFRNADYSDFSPFDGEMYFVDAISGKFWTGFLYED